MSWGDEDDYIDGNYIPHSFNDLGPYRGSNSSVEDDTPFWQFCIGLILILGLLGVGFWLMSQQC